MLPTVVLLAALSASGPIQAVDDDGAQDRVLHDDASLVPS